MREVGKSARGIKLTVAKWSKGIGLKYNRRRMEGYLIVLLTVIDMIKWIHVSIELITSE